MSDLRVYEVEVTVKMYVVASSDADAEEIAEENVEEEIGNGIAEFFPRVVTTTDECGDADMLPWGVDDDDPRRDWTVRQWLETKDAVAKD